MTSTFKNVPQHVLRNVLTRRLTRKEERWRQQTFAESKLFVKWSHHCSYLLFLLKTGSHAAHNLCLLRCQVQFSSDAISCSARLVQMISSSAHSSSAIHAPLTHTHLLIISHWLQLSTFSERSSAAFPLMWEDLIGQNQTPCKEGNCVFSLHFSSLQMHFWCESWFSCYPCRARSQAVGLTRSPPCECRVSSHGVLSEEVVFYPAATCFHHASAKLPPPAMWIHQVAHATLDLLQSCGCL